MDLIGSHGQTIFHQGKAVPYLGARVASTLQIGEAAVIAAQTGVTTVADFRPADMAVGGQGAPLVPYADYLLYGDARLGRVSLNLGGIANVTVIPAGAAQDALFAFDTGPANMLIDALVAHFTRGRPKFDDGARMALAGRAIPALLDELMRDPYLRVEPPKSTGREYYGADYLEKVLALGRKHRAKPNDLIRCATIFTALSVVDALNRFVIAAGEDTSTDCFWWGRAESVDHGAIGRGVAGYGGGSFFEVGSAGRGEGGVCVCVVGL